MTVSMKHLCGRNKALLIDNKMGHDVIDALGNYKLVHCTTSVNSGLCDFYGLIVNGIA